MSRLKKLTVEIEAVVADLYQKNMTYEEIIKSINIRVSHNTICRIIKKYGVKRNFLTNPKNCVEHTYFSAIDHPNKAYWLGMLMADGYVNQKRCYISLQLQEIDAAIIEEFGKDLGSKRKVVLCHKVTKAGTSTLQLRQVISSRLMVKDLQSYGVVQNKSTKESVPNIAFISHFIRGMIDGDGTIAVNKKGYPIIQMVGSYESMEKIRNILVKETNIRACKISMRSNTTGLYLIAWSGLSQCKKICRYIYKDAERYMARKKMIADAILKASDISELSQLILQK